MNETEVLGSDPMTVSTGKTQQVAVRLTHDAVDRARRIATALHRPGLEEPTFAYVIRAILTKGIEAWETELGLSKPAAKPKAKVKR
jgi:hypothetical protein